MISNSHLRERIFLSRYRRGGGYVAPVAAREQNLVELNLALQFNQMELLAKMSWRSLDSAGSPRHAAFNTLGVVSIKGAAHWSQWEKPEEVNRFMIEYLKRKFPGESKMAVAI